MDDDDEVRELNAQDLPLIRSLKSQGYTKYYSAFPVVPVHGPKSCCALF